MVGLSNEVHLVFLPAPSSSMTDKQHECRVCSRRFARSEHLARHHRTRKFSILPTKDSLKVIIMCKTLKRSRIRVNFALRNSSGKTYALGMRRLALRRPPMQQLCPDASVYGLPANHVADVRLAAMASSRVASAATSVSKNVSTTLRQEWHLQSQLRLQLVRALEPSLLFCHTI